MFGLVGPLATKTAYSLEIKRAGDTENISITWSISFAIRSTMWTQKHRFALFRWQLKRHLRQVLILSQDVN